MPLRKHTKPPPRFTFVTPEIEGNQMRWLKTHSDATRSHAAYWSGPAKRRWQTSKESNQKKDNANAMGACADERSDPHGTNAELRYSGARTFQCHTSKTLVDIVALPSKGDCSISRQIELIDAGYPQILSTELREMSYLSVDLTVLKFYSPDFVRRFVMVDNEDRALMFTSCLLLGYAYHMALTGQGTRMILLELKSQVIRHLTAKMNTSDGMLSPRCLIAILALGAPIVCLVSRDLPRGLSIREYINMTLEEDCLCNEESAVVARVSLSEQIVHRQALHRLFLKTRANFQDLESIALLRYISNHMNMYSNSIDRSIAIEAADFVYAPPADIGTLFPVTGSCQKYTVSEEWVSPLTCQWVEGASTAYNETQMLLLTRLVHKWFATFVDENNDPLTITNNILQRRAKLREEIESFGPAIMNANAEEEAMYECCRQVTSILLVAEKLRIPIYVATNHVESKPKLTKLFHQTNLANLWGRHKGLLFWVAATCQFATTGQCFPLLCTTLFARLVQELSMSNIYAEVAINSLRRLKQFESSYCYK
ncbi:hypothetical protein V8C42DRAFT_361842 [Trichoderma barbatum]